MTAREHDIEELLKIIRRATAQKMPAISEYLRANRLARDIEIMCARKARAGS